MPWEEDGPQQSTDIIKDSSAQSINDPNSKGPDTSGTYDMTR
jgi:hypothetical protein